MKGSNGVLSAGRAQTYLGKMSAYRKADETVLRGTQPTIVTNNRTAGQMYQRLKMYATAPLYKVLSEAIALGWENIPQGQSLYNRYTAGAMRSTPFGITKELHDKGAGIAWAAQITNGSLDMVAVNDARVTNIALRGLPVITGTTTVGQLADAVVAGNPGIYEYDDEIAFIEVLQSVDAEGTPKLSCTRAAVTLEKDSKVALSTLVSLKGFSVNNGYLAMTGQPAVGAFCWVHSRMTQDGLKVSTQSLIPNNDFILQQYGAPTALRKAAKSLGADLFSEKFLKPTTSMGRKALRAFAIDANATKSTQGSVASQVLGLEYADVAMFAGEDAPEIDFSVSKQVKVILTDISRFDIQDMQVSVNGKLCTNVSVNDNVVSAMMPDSVDGDYLKSINLSDGLTSASIRLK